jgi:hypothetical protein
MHYFTEDMIGVTAATLISLLLIVVPGFGIAELLGRAGLMPEQGTKRACWALLLGPTLLPAVDALLLRWLGMGGVLVLHVALAAVGIRSALQCARTIPPRWWWAVVGCFAAVAWANVDFDWNGRLYQSVVILDGVKHAAVVGSLATFGAPLHDPFVARPGIAGYYYYFYIAPALIHWIAAPLVDSRAGFAAGTFVTLLAFPAMLMLVGDAAGLIGERARRRYFRAIILLCFVSGLDLLPGLWIWMKTGDMVSQLDWWSEEIRWALTSILWVPHHMTAVVAVYTGCLLVARSERRNQVAHGALAGLAFATAFGSSLWVALAAAPILALWWLYDRTKAGSPPIWALPQSAAAALLVSVPQIADIYTGRTMTGPPLALYMRPLGPIHVLPHTFGQWIVHLAVMPGGYLMEFGIFGLGAIVFLMRGGAAQSRSTSIGRLLLIGAPVALLLVTFVRSAVIYNDFGWRAVWFAQVPAMLWTAAMIAATPKRLVRSPVWTVTFALGLAAVVWDVAGIRLIRPYFFPVFINQHPDVDYDTRGAYAWIDRTVPAGVIVQHNPTDTGRAFDFGLYSDRPVAVADAEARLFGAPDQAVQARLGLLNPIFAQPMPMAELRRRAAAAGVGGVLLTSADPLWHVAGGPPGTWTCQYRTPRSCVMLLEKRQ